MSATSESLPTAIVACDCLTPFGDADATVAALLENKVALKPHPVLGRDGGDLVPLALMGGSMDETVPPRWLEDLRTLANKIPAAPQEAGWGSSRAPVVVTSSNFGVGSMYAFMRDRDARHLQHGPPWTTVELLGREFGWGGHVTVFSHACVTAHLGLAQAARLLHAGIAEQVLVFSFDFVSPFVAGGFHSLKILNGAMPSPYAARDIGAIGLGDGAAFAVLTRAGSQPSGGFRIEGHALFNEMFHFTSNQPEGAGFDVCAGAIAKAVNGRRVWIKGHGTGTLEAGRLEAETAGRLFPQAPLVSWKGSLGHTLGSCGLVELAIALAALRSPQKKIPGTVGGAAPSFTDRVALASFASEAFDAAVLTSNAFGGAHAAMVVSHE
jgi:3-oxoacyl-(acyl-carrier-protein) synthase